MKIVINIKSTNYLKYRPRVRADWVQDLQEGEGPIKKQ